MEGPLISPISVDIAVFRRLLCIAMGGCKIPSTREMHISYHGQGMFRLNKQLAIRYERDLETPQKVAVVV